MPQAECLIIAHREHLNVRAPSQAYPGDAGWDLYADLAGPVPILSGEVKRIPTGLRIALPDGYYARIVGRSSTFEKHRTLVVEGIIDAGYRGPLFTSAWNHSSRPLAVQPGDRLGQMLICPVIDVAWVWVDHEDSLPPSERGTGGFGSSGS